MRTWWLSAVIILGACLANAPPNVGIATLDSFPKLDSIHLLGRLAQADAILSGTIVKTERDERYEDLCALTCRLRGGSEPPRFYYSKIQIDSLITKRDATEVKVGGERWVAWGVRAPDWMPGVGLKALFLVRHHCWADFDKMRVSRTQAGGLWICDIMWSLADLQDVQDTTQFGFAWRHRNQLGTRSEGP